jgi:hypothetical protein
MRPTPAAWTLWADEHGRISGIGPDGAPLFARPGDSDYRSEDEYAANLALAEMAPTLLAALKGVMGWAEGENAEFNEARALLARFEAEPEPVNLDALDQDWLRRNRSEEP